MARKSASSSSPLDSELKRLYTLPLGEFTPERNALAKRLQKEGDREAADQVKALPKASVSAWAVNQLFAREADRMKALLAAGERARSALQHTLTVGDAEVLREALQEERERRDDLRHRAAAILSEDLRAASQAILDRVAVNLDALALSPAAAEEAARGWLSHDLEPPGFEVLSGLQLLAGRPDRRGLRLVPTPPSARPAPEKKPAEKPGPVPRRDRATDKLAAEVERKRKAEEAARERQETRLRERVERAQEKVDRLAAEADTLHREAERAEREAAEAERAVQEATRSAALARGDADRVRQRAERAAADVTRAEKDLEIARRGWKASQ
jgi:DNA repair exonuclease SbcCD ATPase subunit